jgi:PadR family transcriptional regulator, regulatory protein PadR
MVTGLSRGQDRPAAAANFTIHHTLDAQSSQETPHGSDPALAIHCSSMYKAAMRTKRTNPDFLNGVPELLILSLLSRRSMYGYELGQAIRQTTGGTLEFGEGCIYPILHRLEAEGLLAAKRMVVGGRNRVVYRITTKGSKKFSLSLTTWQDVVRAIQRALQGGKDGQPALV